MLTAVSHLIVCQEAPNVWKGCEYTSVSVDKLLIAIIFSDWGFAYNKSRFHLNYFSPISIF